MKIIQILLMPESDDQHTLLGLTSHGSLVRIIIRRGSVRESPVAFIGPLVIAIHEDLKGTLWIDQEINEDDDEDEDEKPAKTRKAVRMDYDYEEEDGPFDLENDEDEDEEAPGYQEMWEEFRRMLLNRSLDYTYTTERLLREMRNIEDEYA